MTQTWIGGFPERIMLVDSRISRRRHRHDDERRNASRAWRGFRAVPSCRESLRAEKPLPRSNDIALAVAE
jgi:hypothetical protein